MANLITSSRLLLLFVVIALAYVDRLDARLAAFALLILVFVMDGVDGWVARLRGEESLFGAVFDIAADRIVENVLWLVLADLNRVPVWVAVVFLVRSFLVDAVRAVGASQGHAPFAATRSSLGRWLVAGRFMRGAYGVVKVLAFGWLFLMPVLQQMWPRWWMHWGQAAGAAAQVLVLAAVTLCLVRGVPVLFEFILHGGGRPERASGRRLPHSLRGLLAALRPRHPGLP